MTDQLEPEESLDRSALEALQRQKLAGVLGVVRKSNAFYRSKWAGTAFDPIRDPMVNLPLTDRAELQADQAAHPPYGSNLTLDGLRYVRVHQTSGSMGTPMRWLDTPESWRWWKACWRYIYRGAGVTPHDRMAFPFSFGPFVGFWGAFEAAADLGHFVLPCGGMTTAARLRHMLDNGVTVVCCTPTYALHMAEVAAAEGIELATSSVRALIVAGEPGGSVPATRRRIEALWGARVFDHVGMTDVGPWGFECTASPMGVHVIESEFIAEIVNPASGAVLPPGEEGELVLTNLGRVGMPAIRYRTGDRAVLSQDRCSCGRTFARVEGGIRGRLDDMLLIRGNNVFPSAIEDVVRSFDAVTEYALRVRRRGSMTDLCVDIEASNGCDANRMTVAIAEAIRNRFHFRAEVAAVPSGTLPRFELKAKRVIREDVED